MPKRRTKNGGSSSEASAADYKVGYGKPPKASRFKAGRSGNPKGRPKHATTIPEALHRRLFAKVPVSENGKRKMITVVEAIFARVAQSSLSGDSRAIGHLIKLINSSHIAAGSGGPSSVHDPAADLLALQEILRSMGITPESIGGKEEEDE